MNETSNVWRFFVNDHDGNGVPTIYRARPYQLPEDYSGDSWQSYWDGDGMVAFTVGYRWLDFRQIIDSGETTRAINAYMAAWNHNDGRDRDIEQALKRVAQRITGVWDADFICVGLDRGYDLYVMTYDGDPDRTWADEIEALYHGDVWRMEVEEYTGDDTGLDGAYLWQTSDNVCDEWYGEDKAQAAWVKDFPLDEFPAHLIVPEVGA